jgi:NhaP-type Na+/H+ or K+/H+ antiporter
VYEYHEEESRLGEPHTVAKGVETLLLYMPLNFLYTWAVSIAIGVVIGIIGSLILKKVTSLTESVVPQLVTLFLVAIVGFYAGDIVKASGVASLVTSAVIYKNFAWYNMSAPARKSSV